MTGVQANKLPVVSQRIAPCTLWDNDLQVIPSLNEMRAYYTASSEPISLRVESQLNLWVVSLQVNDFWSCQSTKVDLRQIFSTFCILGSFMKFMSGISGIFMFVSEIHSAVAIGLSNIVTLGSNQGGESRE